MKIYTDDFNKLNFCDYRVIEMVFEKDSKKINIKLDGAFYKAENQEQELGGVDIKILAWESIFIAIDSDKFLGLSQGNYQSLKEICFAKKEGKILKFGGFSNTTGLWVEYKIIFPLIQVFFQSIKDLKISTMEREKLDQLSKLVSHILRHVNAEYGFKVEKKGWVSINHLLGALQSKEKKWQSISEVDLIEMNKLFHSPFFEIKSGRIQLMNL